MAWRKAHQLALAIYRVTASFPKEELYSLTTQLCRAASSIPANLAEGCGRDIDGEFSRYCSIALGSASELEYHLLLAKDLNLLRDSAFRDLAAQTIKLKRMLCALHKKLKADR